jgi:hypothetical protein
MLHIVLAGREHDVLTRFGAALCGIGLVGITQVDSAAETLKAVDAGGIDLVVVGQSLADTSPVDCITRLVRQNAMINCTMISAMEQDAFHEATEGLGILMQLPPNPSSDDAAVLLAKIKSLSLLLGGEAGKGTRQ